MHQNNTGHQRAGGTDMLLRLDLVFVNNSLIDNIKYGVLLGRSDRVTSEMEDGSNEGLLKMSRVFLTGENTRNEQLL